MQTTSVLRLSDNDRTTYSDGQTTEYSPDDPQWSSAIDATTVLVPGIDILLTRTDAPSRQLRQLAQAIPYTLEEELTEDIDNLHFALGTHADDGINVAVTRRERMEHWLETLTEAALTPKQLIPDILAVPRPENGWGILCIGEHALVHTGSQAGFAIEKSLLPEMLLLKLQESQANPPARICFYRGQQAHHAKPVLDAETLDALTQQDIEVEEKHHDDGLMAWFATGVTENGDALNLLQASYRPANKVAALWQLWRPTAIMAGVLAVLWLLLQWQTLSELSAQETQLSERINDTYQATFPQSPVRGYSLQAIEMENRLKALRSTLQGDGASGFLASLATMTAFLNQAPGLRLNRIDYRQQRFDIHLRIAGLQALETLRQSLQQNGFEAEIRAIDDSKDYVEGRLILSLAAN